jgi:predicted nuclease of predicted toxin-antitoxin system
MSMTWGAPPKVVWLKVGNGSTDAIAQNLRARRNDIKRLHADTDATLLIIKAS